MRVRSSTNHVRSQRPAASAYRGSASGAGPVGRRAGGVVRGPAEPTTGPPAVQPRANAATAPTANRRGRTCPTSSGRAFELDAREEEGADALVIVRDDRFAHVVLERSVPIRLACRR